MINTKKFRRDRFYPVLLADDVDGDGRPRWYFIDNHLIPYCDQPTAGRLWMITYGLIGYVRRELRDDAAITHVDGCRCLRCV